jgi:hypothetical protein
MLPPDPALYLGPLRNSPCSILLAESLSLAAVQVCEGKPRLSKDKGAI